MCKQNIDDKNAGKLLVILVAIWIRQYNAGCIVQWSTSQASLEATGCRRQASAWDVLPQQPPWSTILNRTQKH
jgi:hypothetical protein